MGDTLMKVLAVTDTHVHFGHVKSISTAPPRVSPVTLDVWSSWQPVRMEALDDLPSKPERTRKYRIRRR